MDAICALHWECIGQFYPLVSLYPSVFTLRANYSVLQTQMNINQPGESAQVFPSVIKQWFKVRVVKICRCEFAPLPSSRNTKHHLSGVIYGLWGSAGWLGLRPPTRRKTVGPPIRMATKTLGQIYQTIQQNLFLPFAVARESKEIYGPSSGNWYISGNVSVIRHLWVLEILH